MAVTTIRDIRDESALQQRNAGGNFVEAMMFEAKRGVLEKIQVGNRKSRAKSTSNRIITAYPLVRVRTKLGGSE